MPTWTTKPSAPSSINSGAPFVANLKLLVPCNETTGNPKELVNLTTLTDTGFGTTWATNAAGACIVAGAGGHAWLLFTDQAAYWPTAACTICIIRRPTNTTTTNAGILGNQDGTYGTNRLALDLTYFSDARWDFGGTSTPNKMVYGDGTSAGSYTRQTANPEAWVVTAGSSGMKMWLDGVLVATNSTAIAARTNAGAGVNCILGSSYEGVDDTEINYLAVYNIQWTQSNVDHWLANLYELITVAAPPPDITSVSPTVIAQGATITFNVFGTNFSGSIIGLSGTGLTVGSTTVDSPTQCHCSITAAGGATLSARTVTVINGDAQQDQLVGGLTVVAPSTGPGPERRMTLGAG